MRIRAGCCAAAVALSMLGGCLQSQLRRGSSANAPFALAGPFVPASIRVHPLTRVDRSPQGDVVIVAHVQMRDRWSDLCKGVGIMQFFLYRPTGLGGAGQEEQVLRWDIDLYDLDANAVFFDPATQTYRFSLRELPEWVQQMAPGSEASGRFRLGARFSTPAPEGGLRVLVDELIVSR